MLNSRLLKLSVLLQRSLKALRGCLRLRVSSCGVSLEAIATPAYAKLMQPNYEEQADTQPNITQRAEAGTKSQEQKETNRLHLMTRCLATNSDSSWLRIRNGACVCGAEALSLLKCRADRKRTERHKDRETDRQIDRKTKHRQTDKQTDRQTGPRKLAAIDRPHDPGKRAHAQHTWQAGAGKRRGRKDVFVTSLCVRTCVATNMAVSGCGDISGYCSCGC